ncbi:hypothetical protein Taro_006208 [Colocasia esculenta]|uniref:TRAF-type domain-containing protein n=1 Tax=Colocasia esculenta TaxID=4460 RepID=A0A843TRX7_COLES|nr:hypothetical protein [Colocasia esculenta]
MCDALVAIKNTFFFYLPLRHASGKCKGGWYSTGGAIDHHCDQGLRQTARVGKTSQHQTSSCIMLIAPATLKDVRFVETWYQRNMQTSTTTIIMLQYVHCSLCSATVEREDLALHRDEECPRRIITCDSCQFPLPAVDLAKHQEVCGNRRVFCDICNSYVRLRELLRHQLEFHHSSNGASACSSSRTAGNAAEREGGGDRRRRQAPQTGHDAALRWRIIVPIAVTGVAIAIGSFFFQKRTDTQQQSQ